jgi:hypothetical protein
MDRPRVYLRTLSLLGVPSLLAGWGCVLGLLLLDWGEFADVSWSIWGCVFLICLGMDLFFLVRICLYRRRFCRLGAMPDSIDTRSACRENMFVSGFVFLCSPGCLALALIAFALRNYPILPV